jgi:hypothetical protein
MTIPAFLPDGNLPAGIHLASWQEVETILGFNDRRRELLAGLKRACQSLKQAGCNRIYIGGSFATNKEFPGDFDVCYSDDSLDYVLLQQIDPVIRDLRNKRAAQKAKYGGELFPSSVPADLAGRTFLEFFQTDRDGNPKGIIAIDL